MGTKQSMKRREGMTRKVQHLIDNGSIPSPEHKDKYGDKHKNFMIYGCPSLLDEISTKQNTRNISELSYERTVTVSEKLTVKRDLAKEFDDYRNDIYNSLSRFDEAINSRSKENNLGLISRIGDLFKSPLAKKIENEERKRMHYSFNELETLFLASIVPSIDGQYFETCIDLMYLKDKNEEMKQCFEEFEQDWVSK